MPEITQTILAAIANNLSMDTKHLCVDEQSTGFLRKKKTLHIWGNVQSQDQSVRVEAIVRKHAGTNYEVANHLVVI